MSQHFSSSEGSKLLILQLTKKCYNKSNSVKSYKRRDDEILYFCTPIKIVRNLNILKFRKKRDTCLFQTVKKLSKYFKRVRNMTLTNCPLLRWRSLISLIKMKQWSPRSPATDNPPPSRTIQQNKAMRFISKAILIFVHIHEYLAAWVLLYPCTLPNTANFASSSLQSGGVKLRMRCEEKCEKLLSLMGQGLDGLFKGVHPTYI